MVVHPVRALALGLVLLAAPALLQAAEGSAQANPAPAQKSAVKGPRKASPSPTRKAAAASKPAPASQAPAAQPAAPADEAAVVETEEQVDPATGRRGAFSPSTKVSAKTGRRVVVITDDDLERMYGPSSPPPAAAEPAAEPAAGTEAPAPEAAGEAVGDGTAAADPQARAAAIQDELQRLQQKERHLKNPFLPPAKESEAERNAEKGLGAIQRLQQTQERMTQLKEELRQLQEKQQPPPATPPTSGGQ